nr:cytochrome P460 family protein [uncultured Pedobacter sp.]
MKRKSIIGMILFGLALTLGCSSELNDSLNDEASVGSVQGLPENPLLLTALTTSIRPDNGTTSTLYGNKIAVHHTSTQENTYPAGTVLYNVTWKQKADPHWFGARVPGKVFSVERVSIGLSGEMVYELYKGSPLRLVAASDHIQRLSQVLSIKPAVSP